MKFVALNEFEKIVSEDWNDQARCLHQSIYDKVLYPFFKKQSGCIGDSLFVERVDSTRIKVKAGRAFLFDPTQTGVNPKYRSIQLNEDLDIDLGGEVWEEWPEAPENRWDIVVVRPREEVIQSATRLVRTAGVGPIVEASVDKIVEQTFEIDVVAGEASEAPIIPATPAGWIKVAEVFVTGGAGIATAEDIIDARTVLVPNIASRASDTRYVSPGGDGTDTSLAAAISNLPPEGGTIILMESVSLTSALEIPEGSVLRGLCKSVVLTINGGGSLVLSDDVVLENLTVATDDDEMPGLVEMAGDRVKIQNILFSMPNGAESTAVLWNGDGGSIEGCDFLECDEHGSNRSVEVDGSTDNHRISFDRVITIAANTTIGPQHSGAVLLVDTSGGQVDLQLDGAQRGFHFTVKDKTGSFGTNKCRLLPDGASLIEGLNQPYEMTADWGAWKPVADSTNWFLI